MHYGITIWIYHNCGKLQWRPKFTEKYIHKKSFPFLINANKNKYLFWVINAWYYLPAKFECLFMMTKKQALDYLRWADPKAKTVLGMSENETWIISNE